MQLEGKKKKDKEQNPVLKRCVVVHAGDKEGRAFLTLSENA